MNVPSPARFSMWRVGGFIALIGMLATTSFVSPPRYRDSSLARQSRWLLQQASDAYTAKHYDVAAESYEQLNKLMPYDAVLQFNIACCRARAGQPDQSIAALQRSVEYGWEDADLIKSAPALESVQDDARLPAILESAHAHANEGPIVYAPAQLDPDKPAPLVVLLHGRGSSPRNIVPAWKAAADSLGLVIVAPRGPAKLESGRYGWEPSFPSSNGDLDVRAIDQSITHAIELAAKDHDIDRNRIVIVGFSQGGHAALRAFHDHPDWFSGIVTCVTVYHAGMFDDWPRSSTKRAVLYAGKLDSLCPHSRVARDDMRAAGLDVRYEEFDDMGHEPPPDYQQRQIEAIKFVLRG